MNSNRKGKSGEREFAAYLRGHGIEARRGQQFSGSPDSPDVISSLPFHVEVKRVESLNLGKACEQAASDAGGRPWVVASRRNRGPWLITMNAETFLSLVREGVKA